MAESVDENSQSVAGGSTTLTAWALATFDVLLFVLVAVLATHASGALGDLLAGLNTLVGVGIFAYLWALVAVAVRWVLAGAPLGETSVGTLAVRGLVAGAVTGVAFLLGAFVVAVLPLLLSNPIEAVSLVLIPALGSVVAAIVGVIVGLLFALVNVAVFRAAAAIVPTPAERERPAAADVTPDRP